MDHASKLPTLFIRLHRGEERVIVAHGRVFKNLSQILLRLLRVSTYQYRVLVVVCLVEILGGRQILIDNVLKRELGGKSERVQMSEFICVLSQDLDPLDFLTLRNQFQVDQLVCLLNHSRGYRHEL